MKTCSRCGQTYPPEVTFCTRCGLLLPGWRGFAGPADGDAEVAHIEFLLQQITGWVERGWVRPEQAQRLQDEYQERRWRRLNPAPPPVATLPEAEVTVPPPPMPPPPQARHTFPLAAFFEEKNLSLWQLVGALLLLAGLVGLVRWTWGSVGKYLVLALMLSLTAGLFTLARSHFVREQRLTRSALLAIAALLVPLDIVAVNAFRLLGRPLDASSLGLLTSVFCLPLYLWLTRRETGRWPVVLAGGEAAITLYFFVHALLQAFSATVALELRGALYGLAYAGLAVPFLLAARRTGEERRGVWLQAAYGATLAAPAFALWLGGVGLTGALAATFLLIGGAYGLAAGLFEDRDFAHLSLAAVTLGGALALHRLGRGGGADHWDTYAVWVQAMGMAAWAVGKILARQGRESLASACTGGGRTLGVLSVTIQAVSAILSLGEAFPGFTMPAVELGERLACAGLSLGFFTLAGLETVAAGLMAYSFVLLGLLLSRFAPAHTLWRDQPNLAALLALSAFLLRWRRQERVALAVGALGLLTGGVSASADFFWQTTLLALPLLAIFFASQSRTVSPLLVWPAAVAALLEILLAERHTLPWTQRQWGWEPNYGFGLCVFTLAGLAVAEQMQRRETDDPRAAAWTQAALGVGILTALLQIGYAPFPAFALSPLLVLGAGAFFAGAVGSARHLPRAADWAAALTAGLYLAFALGHFAASSSDARETLVASLLLPLALLLAFLAVRRAHPLSVSAAALAGALSLVHALHRALHPAPALYALALWPLVASLHALGLRLIRRAGDVWQPSLTGSALLIALTALLSATIETLRPGSPGEMLLLAALGAYGLLYAVLAGLTHRTGYTGLSFAAWSGAYLLPLIWHAPPLSLPLLSFRFSFAGLFWLALAHGADRLALARFAASSLRRAALAVGALTLVMALIGLGENDARFAVYALLIVGSVFLGASWGLETPVWGHLGVATYFLAYFLFLAKRLGTPDLASSDFYLIPAGLYVLTLGLLAKRRAAVSRSGSHAAGYFLTGLLLTLTPTFLAAWQAGAAPVHALLLLTECVVALFYGIAARTKVFVGAGAAFLVALLERETQGMVSHIHWAVYATLLGLAILSSALFLEKRREEVRRWAQAAQEKLKEWD